MLLINELNRKEEAKNMITEDLLVHLGKQEEKRLMVEELSIYIEALEGYCTIDNIDDSTYYIQLVQKIAEELLIDSTKKDLNGLINDIATKKLSVNEIEANIQSLCSSFNLHKYKENYIRVYNDTIKKCKVELEASNNLIKKIEDDIEYCNKNIRDVLRSTIEIVLS